MDPRAEQTAPAGLRQRKKQRTREHIAETARRLFTERGFERVTVAEVAREAEVSEGTVFNYFPRKEDLVYHRLESFEQELLRAVRERPGDETISAAFGRWLLSQRGLLAETPISPELRALTRMIATSPALQAREAQIFARYTLALAGLIAEETGAGPDDIRPWVAANALLGVQRALIALTRGRIDAGAENPGLSEGITAEARRALSALQTGLGTGFGGGL
jgi:AcrR family transcriptional regulator